MEGVVTLKRLEPRTLTNREVPDATMKSITVTHREHDPPHEEFRLRVATANAAHAFAPLITSR